MFWLSRLDRVDPASQSEPKCLGGWPFQPTQRFHSHANASPRFVMKCAQSWFAKGSSGREVIFVPGTSIHHINGAFIRTLRSDTSHSKGTGFLLVLPVYLPLFKFRVSFKLKTSDFRVRLHYFFLLHSFPLYNYCNWLALFVIVLKPCDGFSVFLFLSLKINIACLWKLSNFQKSQKNPENNGTFWTFKLLSRVFWKHQIGWK